MIRFILGQPLPQIVMSDTILSAYSYIAATMALDGDNILPQEEDPFIYNKLYGAKFEAFSADETLPRRLTWGHLEGTVLGLYNGLYLRGKYKTALFYIHDTVGVVGMGELQVDKVDFKANTTLQIHHLPLEQPSLR